MAATESELQTLDSLLRQRLAIIADSGLHTAEPEAHLAALRGISEAIEAEHQRLKPQLPPRLRHYLQQASYQKALAWIQGEES